MRTTDTIIIGAGQAGLAASTCLIERGHDHVVLERGHLGQRWTSDTWDSLRLLTPNWMNELPGWAFLGPDPHGYMTAAEFTAHLSDYAHSFDAPVEEHTAVETLLYRGDAFEVVSDRDTYRAASVVIATGWCDRPAVPSMARQLAPDVAQIVPSAYRNPASVVDGGVLVVGASATGVQIADELCRAGRDVTLAVGSHSRLDKTIDEVPDVARARHEPSLQLVGRPDRRSLDLATLQDDGVELVGRVAAIDGHHIGIAGDLAMTVAAADDRMYRILGEIDDHIERNGLSSEVFDAEPIPTIPAGSAVDTLDVRAAGIRTVIWATGHRRSYPWLQIPVLDADGELRQRRGVTPVPGLYVLGQRFQHYRSSNFIGRVGRDAAYVADHIVAHRPSRLTSN